MNVVYQSLGIAIIIILVCLSGCINEKNDDNNENNSTKFALRISITGLSQNWQYMLIPTLVNITGNTYDYMCQEIEHQNPDISIELENSEYGPSLNITNNINKSNLIIEVIGDSETLPELFFSMEKNTTYNEDLDYTTENAKFMCFLSGDISVNIEVNYSDGKGISSSFTGGLSSGWNEITGERKLILD